MFPKVDKTLLIHVIHQKLEIMTFNYHLEARQGTSDGKALGSCEGGHGFKSQRSSFIITIMAD